MAEIKTICCGEVICRGDTSRLAVIGAIRCGISLAYANLRELNLNYISFGATDLTGADIRGSLIHNMTFKWAYVLDLEYTRGGIHWSSYLNERTGMMARLRNEV